MPEKPTYNQLLDRIKELDACEKWYRSLAENTSDLLYRTDLDGNLLYLSASVYELSGYTVEEGLGLNLARDIYLVPEERERLVSLLQKNGQVRNFSARLKRKDGSVWWASTNAHFFFNRKGEIAGVEGIVRDITELKQAEEKLAVQAQRIKIFFNALNDAIFVHPLREEGFAPFAEVNDVACKRYGYSYEEFLQLSASDITLKSDSDAHSTQRRRRQLLETGHQVFEVIHLKKSGEEFPVEVNSNVIYEGGSPFILTVARDISERKYAEAQLLKIQQLESVATLAGGIAHEFNNALNVVSGSVELLRMMVPDNEAVITFGRKTMESVLRMNKLTTQLHAYARGGKYRLKSIRLNRFITKILPDISSILPSGIKIDTDLSENTSSVNADADQLQMVVSAVLTNASESMEGSGKILIHISEEVVDEAAALAYPGLRTGRYVLLTINDDGRGMDAETKNRIFDPFFTTKFQGRGLGMAAVYGIIKNHDGYIYVDSERGRGTTVRVFLPPKA